MKKFLVTFVKTFEVRATNRERARAVAFHREVEHLEDTFDVQVEEIPDK